MLLKLNLFAISLLPVFLLTGPFLPNVIVSISSIIFLYLIIKKYNLNFLNSNFLLFFIFFLFLFLLSSLVSDNINNSLEHSLFYCRFIFFSIFLSLLVKEHEEISKYIFYILLIIFSFLIIDSYIQFIFKSNIFLMPLLHGRPSSIFGEEFILGSYLSRLFPLLIALAYFKNFFKNYNEIILILLSFFIFITIYLTGERVAIFNNFVTIFFLIILLKSKQLIKYIFIFYFLFITYLVFFSNLFINNRIIQSTIKQMQLFSEQKFLFSKTIEGYYYTGLNMFYANPLLGVGPKNYRIKCDDPEYAHLLSISENCNNHPHNILIQLLAESGIFTSFLYVFFILWLFYYLIKYFFNSIKDRVDNIYKFNFFIFLCLFINISPFLPSGNFFNSWLNSIYYLIVGFIIYSKKLIKEK